MTGVPARATSTASGGDRPGAPEAVAALEARVRALEVENRSLKIALSELERASVLDSLTAAHNRRYFMTQLQDRLARVRRYDAQVALIYVDVDGLKAVNDGHGHAAGDALLMAIANRLKATVRQTDVLARIGGDEFALLLDAIEPADAEAKIADFRAQLNGAALAFDGQTLPLSASFGYTMITAADDADGVIARADAAMYREKAQHHRAAGTAA